MPSVLQPVHIVWFKRDLRVPDHRPLTEAAKRGAVLPLYVVEPELFSQPDMAGRHWDFTVECLSQLSQDLSALGQTLVYRVGTVTEVLQQLKGQFKIDGLWSHEETGNGWTYARDLAVTDWCQSHGVPWTEYRQDGVVRRLASRNGWAKNWDGRMAEPITKAPLSLPPIGIEQGVLPKSADIGLENDDCPGRQTGGRAAGLERLNSFLASRGKDYRWAMSSPISAEEACSRLSPYLAYGAVSMREVAQATWAKQRELKQNEQPHNKSWRASMRSFSGRLHWHCHFMQKLETQPDLEFQNLHPGTEGLRSSEPDAARLKAWMDGATGLPFVDACMRSLKATGWINFRMRAMLMAVASQHLWLHWRKPGEHLARLFTDYEPGIHWSQVQMQSGTTGINAVRIYNPVKQGKDHDPDGFFTRKWVPELASVPLQFIHEPWAWDRAPDVLDRTYPYPIVDHLAAAKEARQKIWAIRKSKAFRDEADRIQTKHGSRKSGVRMRGRTARKQDTRQLALDLDP